MPPSKRHCTGNLHPAFSGQLAGIRVAEDSVGALALLPTVHCDPKGSIRNVAYWGRRVDAAIIPVSTSVKGLFEAHIIVRDLQRSVAFYRDVLGLEVGIEQPERPTTFSGSVAVANPWK